MARTAVELASEKQAEDIVMLDLREVCSFTDYFVICTGTSSRQIRTIVDEVEKGLRVAGIRTLHLEGADDTGWVLMDFGDVIVHVFHPRELEFYGLERLWSNALPVLHIQ
ncbi:MAG: ribosome silencing factor [Chloroflexi bacterium]|nr:ribosome silencing factor [Chloroflexota bacterium]